MKKLLVAGALISTVFTSCNRDSTLAVVEVGSIRYANGSAYPYSIQLDGGSQGIVAPNSSKVVNNVQVGSHILKAVQDSGYILVPITKELTVTVKKGQESVFLFP